VYAFKRVSGVATQLFSDTYDANEYRWFRIRERGGTTFWESSSDGMNWTIRHSAANPITVTALTVFIFTGTWQNESPATNSYFDDLGIYPSNVFLGDF
jgi:hypothetical protein